MRPLADLPPLRLSPAARLWMGILRLYLVVAVGMALFAVVKLALSH
jgi:hypothetical protein